MSENKGTGRLPSKGRSRSRERDWQHNRMFSSIIAVAILLSAAFIGLLPTIEGKPIDGRTLASLILVGIASWIYHSRKAPQ